MPASTTERGRAGEKIAADYLQQQGYHIIAKNHRSKRGEIDIVAEEGEVLCFVEVRSRRSAEHGDPLETVDPRKQARLVRAARHYLSTRRCEQRQVRFDVVGIVYEPALELTLVRNAFEAASW